MPKYRVRVQVKWDIDYIVEAESGMAARDKVELHGERIFPPDPVPAEVVSVSVFKTKKTKVPKPVNPRWQVIDLTEEAPRAG